MKLLIVEDNVEQYLFLKECIEKNNLAEVVTLGETLIDSYELAKKAIDSSDIDLCILDLELNSKKGGVQVAKLLRKKNIPFIVLTAYDTPQHIRDLRELHPLAFYYKTDFSTDLRQIQNVINLGIDQLVVREHNKFCIKARSIKKPKETITKREILNNKYGGDYDFKLISHRDIKYFQKSPNNKNNSILIHDYNSEYCLEIQLSLRQIEDLLPNHYARVSGDLIVNILEIESYANRPFYIHLKGKQYITVTETYRDQVRKRIAETVPIKIG
jgi:DNA-binding LytR/AlgR family response regulator